MPHQDATISRRQAVGIIKMHGWDPDHPTSWNPETREWYPPSSFDAEVGIKTHYTVREIFNWLGY